MWRIKRITQRILLAALLLTMGSADITLVQADAPTAVPSLSISQLKVTSSNGQFVTLYNSTNSVLNMSNYQLEYFNSFDLSKATSSKLVALTGTLPPHSYFMISDGSLQLCYQMVIDSASLGFSTTAGMIEVLSLTQPNPGSYVSSNLQDSVGWSKTAAVGAQTLPTNPNAFLQRLPVDSHNNPAITAPGFGTWLPVQPDPSNVCNIVTISNTNTTPVASGLNQLLPATQPTATIVQLESANPVSDGPSMPAADIGLMAPTITELLPNPFGTGTDAAEEYIELYNPNDVSFDLTGFKLESGLTTLHDYSFPNAFSLAAHSFTAFYAPETKLTLSNTSGQVKLLDPFENTISTADEYTSAADGHAWALANGAWSWTTLPTPGEANVIKLPAPKTTKSKASSKKSKSISTTRGKKLVAKKPPATGSKPSLAVNKTATSIPIHPWVLALIASLALLYAIYEYRYDLANYLRQCGAKLGISRVYRSKITWWRSDRTGE